MDEITEVRYLTDDRDFKDRNELVITLGGNGDWYVAVVPEGQGTIWARSPYLHLRRSGIKRA